MSEYSELVKRLCGTWTMDAVQGDNPQLTELEISDEPAPICQEAAQAIERLERKLETVSTLDKNTIARRTDRITALEAELADARAEIERKDKALERIAYETAATWVADIAHEALATQASTDNPSGEG